MVVSYSGARGLLEDSELWANGDGGVRVARGGDPTLIRCSLHDHVAGEACGVQVSSSARGKATVGEDCVFLRNTKGDVVRA